MALTKKEILSDASDLVTDLIADLAKEGLTFQENLEALKDARAVLISAVMVIDVMTKGKKEPTIH